MSKKTLMVLVFASIVLGCGKNSPENSVVSETETAQQKAVYRSTMNERRKEREKGQERILLLKEELASERKRDAKSERIAILEAELAQLEKEADQQRAETYRLVRERAKGATGKIQKDGGK